MTQSRRMIPDEATRVPLMPKPAIILLVEDEFDVREIVRVFLAEQDYQIIEAGDGDAAMRILETNEPIDLLLTDIVMPGAHDGFALGRAARRLCPGLKVLHVTGFSERIKAHTKLVRQGSLMEKPIDRRELLDRVGRLLGAWAVDQNETLRRTYRYWLDKAAGRAMPDRKDLDPAELKDILPDLSIFEAVGPEPRFRCRLVGTRVVDAFGFDPVNRFIDDLFTSPDSFLRRVLAEVYARAQPLYAASAFGTVESGLCTERLLMPFASPLGMQLVMVQTFDWKSRSATFHELAQQQSHRADALQWGPPQFGDDEPAPLRAACQ
jgi:CheY-like chemotaxis protein